MSSPQVLFAGRTTVDAVYWMDRLPEEDSKAFAQAFRAAPGGPACNAAITCALLGGRATLVSAIGAGPWAAMVREKLDQEGIGLIDVGEGTGYETPLSTVLVNAANSTRTIVNPPLSKEKLTALTGWDPRWGELPRVALTDGFHLEETLPLLKECRNGGCALCLDGGSWKPGTEALAPLLSVAICSERFALSGMQADPEKTIAWFAGHGVPCVAVTRGVRSILSFDHGRRFEVAVPDIGAVDTLGAGDVLHGAFCYYFALSGEFESSLRRAAEIATRSCRGVGIAAWTEPGEAVP
jgi:sugar/nucleoside kinase (ribokinase family)